MKPPMVCLSLPWYTCILYEARLVGVLLQCTTLNLCHQKFAVDNALALRVGRYQQQPSSYLGLGSYIYWSNTPTNHALYYTYIPSILHIVFEAFTACMFQYRYVKFLYVPKSSSFLKKVTNKNQVMQI